MCSICACAKVAVGVKRFFPSRASICRCGVVWKSVLTCLSGGGLYLGHPYGITVNSGAMLGMNVNLHKGCTIGQENRGKRKGTPTIGNCVSVGINSSIVGKITVGDDVLIAPNTYVNFDVPSHSIVLGSPGRIIPREGATDDYIVNRVGILE